MANENRAEAVCEVPESVLGQAEECSCGAKVTDPPKPWCLAWPHHGAEIRRFPGVGLFEQWQAEFRPLLGDTARWEGFCFLMRDQLSREHPCIIETGTLRNAGNWHGDGQSTRLWDWVAKHKRGFVVSVDQDSKACELAKYECQNSHIVCQDSIALFRGFLPVAPTLLYLDSIEWGPTRETNISCWMNQVGELAAVWDKLPSGCLIASDDSQEKDVGKPVLTRRLFQALGIEPEHDSYIVCWRKP